jgi:glycosyltransferase involved in cell wall biosynthesis
VEAGIARRSAIVLTPRLPWPLDDGGRIALWQTVWAAAQADDVTLISFVPPGSETEAVPRPLAELGITVARVPFRPPPPPVAAVVGLWSRWPYTLARYRSVEFERTLRERIAVLTPAYVLANHLHMASYVEAIGDTPMVLRQHNIEHIWMERFARGRGFTPAGLYARAQAARLRRAEASLCRAAALTLAIQEGEAEILRALAPEARVATLPVGIDLARYPPRRPSEPPVLLLAASFAWPPNAEGALRFLAEGWPRVRAGAPNAQLRLAGKSPSASLIKAANRAGAEIAADVPSMPEEFARATMLLVPLWVGAGARVKIVEALAARLPVVATSFACEGLGLTPGAHYLEGESPAELADRALALLRDPARGDAPARAGRAVAEERWSLPAVARLQNELVAQVAR